MRNNCHKEKRRNHKEEIHDWKGIFIAASIKACKTTFRLLRINSLPNATSFSIAPY